MFKTSRTADSFDDEAYTVLEKDASFEGKLTFDGSVQIFGKFKGEIFSSGTLMIGDTAVVEATIEVNVLQIAGHVKGYLNAKERLELMAKSHVVADITTAALVVEQGAKFQGNCQMGIASEQLEERRDRNASYLSSSHERELSSSPTSNPSMNSPLEEIELFQ